MSDTGLAADRICVGLGGAMVLHDVSVSLCPGEWFGVLGVNGSGKTTLLRTLAGRLAPHAGEVRLDGGRVPPAVLAGAVGFAPPPETLPEELRAGELIDLLAHAQGSFLDAAAARIGAALGIAALRGEVLGAMSAGQRQRVCLMLAFLGRPRAVLLDEPFNWLDPVAAYDLKDALAGLVREGLCLVTSLHDVVTFATRCGRGVLLHDGRVAQVFAAQDMAAARADVAGLERRIYEGLKAA